MFEVRCHRAALLVAAVALLAAAPIRAEQAPPPAEPETVVPADPEVDDGKAAEADPENAPPRPGAPAAEVFVPSEEISEDFAVSFPVDI